MASKTIHYGVEDKRIKDVFTLLCGAGRRGRFNWVCVAKDAARVTCTRCKRELKQALTQKEPTSKNDREVPRDTIKALLIASGASEEDAERLSEKQSHKVVTMKPGTKVKIKIDTWMAQEGSTGVVHDKNLTEGLISVKYDEGCGEGVFDFAPEYLEEVT